MKRLTALISVAGILLISAAPAYAQSLSDAYGGGNGNVAGVQSIGTGGNLSASVPANVSSPGSQGGGDVARPARTNSGGSLPFTGADLGLLAGAGVLMLGAGFGVRRLYST